MTNKMKSSRLMDRANHLVAVATKKSGRRALRLHEEAGELATSASYMIFEASIASKPPKVARQAPRKSEK